VSWGCGGCVSVRLVSDVPVCATVVTIVACAGGSALVDMLLPLLLL